MEYRDQIIENQAVMLDGNTYTGCSFRGCRMIYAAVSPFRAVACHFDYCQWAFDGPAARMLDFLKQMYRMEGMRDVIEHTFAEIRGEPHV